MAAEQNVHLASRYFRVFDLAQLGVTGTLSVERVQVGIEVAAAGAGGTQPATLRLHTLNGPLTMGNLTLIGESSVSISNQSLSIHPINVTGTAPAGSKLVVEFYTPDGSASGNVLLIGSNGQGEVSPTYVQAPDCSLAEPEANSGAVGNPSMHWVVSVTGMESL